MLLLSHTNNIKKIYTSLIFTGLFLAGSIPALAATDLQQECVVPIPEVTQTGELMVVFAHGPEGTTATDWKDDGGGQGWTQLGFNALTKGRDTSTAVFYKRNSGEEKTPVFSLTTAKKGVSCAASSFSNDYYYRNSSSANKAESVEAVDAKESDTLENDVATSTDAKSETKASAVVTLEEHPEGQVENMFAFKNKKNVTLFTFSLSASTSQPMLDSVKLEASKIKGITTNNIENIVLYKDIDKNAEYTKNTDEFIGGGNFSVNEGTEGTIIFEDLNTTAIGVYLVTVDTSSVKRRDSIKVSLMNIQIYLEDDDTINVSVDGEVSSVIHKRSSGESPNFVPVVSSEGQSGGTPPPFGGQPPPPPPPPPPEGGGQALPPGG